MRARLQEIFRVFAQPELGDRRGSMKEEGRFALVEDADAGDEPDASAPAQPPQPSAPPTTTRRAPRPSIGRFSARPAGSAGADRAQSRERGGGGGEPDDDGGLARQDSSSTMANDMVSARADLHRVVLSTLTLLAFDLFPAFLRSRLLTGLASSLMQTAKDQDLELSIRMTRSTAPQDADDWMSLFCAVAENLKTAVIVCDMIRPGVPIMFVNKAFERLTEYTCVRERGSARERASERVREHAERARKARACTVKQASAPELANTLDRDRRREARYQLVL
jgi:PAS domain-containing protein